MPIEAIGKNLDEVLLTLANTLSEMQRLAGSANADLLPSMTASLSALEQTLGSAESMIAPDSAMTQEIERMVSDLSEASRSFRGLAERLEEHPEELLRGKSE